MSRNTHQIPPFRVKFTLFNSNRPLAKEYWLENDVINKLPNGAMSSGMATTIDDKFNKLGEYLENADEYTAFGWGICNQTKVKIVNTDVEDLVNLKYGRNRQNFNYREGEPAIMTFDHDLPDHIKFRDDETYEYSPKRMLLILYSICPSLRNAPMFIRDSISSGVKKIGKKQRPKGYHIHILVEDGSKIPEFGRMLFKHLWMLGHGYIFVSKCGSLLPRACIDAAVFEGERLVFEGKPRLGKGLEFKNPIAKLLHADGIPFNCEIVAVNEDLFNNRLEQAKKLKEQEAQVNRALWSASRLEQLTVRHGAEKANEILNKFLDSEVKELYPEYVLYTRNKTEVTVQAIMDDPIKFDKIAFYDPMDGLDYHICSKFYYNKGKPFIHSRAHGLDINYWLKRTWQQELEFHVDETNKKWCKVMYRGKAVIAVESTDESNHPVYKFVEAKELAKNNSQFKLKVGEIEQKYGIKDVICDRVNAWTNHVRANFRENVVFQPIKPVIGQRFKSTDSVNLNIWRGLSVVAHKNRKILKALRNHMKYIMCENQEEYEYLCKWCAYTIQNPDKPAETCVVLQGEEGAGKGQFGQFLLSIWGSHGMQIQNSEQLTGRFNEHLARVCYVFADEAMFAGDHAAIRRLKGLVTESVIQTEAKGKDLTCSRNFLKILMAANDDWVVPAGRDSRRWFVLLVNSDMKHNRQYWDNLASSLSDKEVQSAFVEWMLSIDLTGWHPQFSMPMTNGLIQQRKASFNSIQLWFSHCLSLSKFRDIDDGWTEVMTNDKLHESYMEWCNSHKADKWEMRVSSDSIGKYLSKIEGFRRINNNGQRGYIFGDINHANQAFQQHEKLVLKHVKLVSPCAESYEGELINLSLGQTEAEYKKRNVSALRNFRKSDLPVEYGKSLFMKK